MKPFAWILAFAALLSACSLFDRDRPVPERQLPPITNEGANTFGCKIDGEVYIPRTPWEAALSGRPSIVNSYGILSDRDRFFVATNNVDREDSIDQAMDIIIERLVVGDTLWLGTNDGAYPPLYTERYANFRNKNQSQRFATWSEDSLTYSGYVVLSGLHYEYDGNPRFVAGTFAFTARNADSTKYIEVTEGRFDVRLSN